MNKLINIGIKIDDLHQSYLILILTRGEEGINGCKKIGDLQKLMN
jgi:hypothetical protein